MPEVVLLGTVACYSDLKSSRTEIFSKEILLRNYSISCATFQSSRTQTLVSPVMELKIEKVTKIKFGFFQMEGVTKMTVMHLLYTYIVKTKLYQSDSIHANLDLCKVNYSESDSISPTPCFKHQK